MLSGFMSFDLKAAKNNSIGEASYECGPVKMTGTWYSSKNAIMLLEVWYGALSSMMTVFCLQAGRC